MCKEKLMTPEEVKIVLDLLNQIKILVSSNTSQWVLVFGTILGAIVGSISTFIPTYLINRWQNKKRASNSRFTLLTSSKTRY